MAATRVENRAYPEVGEVQLSFRRDAAISFVRKQRIWKLRSPLKHISSRRKLAVFDKALQAVNRCFRSP